VAEPEVRRIRIRALAHGGAGVGSFDGEADAAATSPVWFVEGALPGELVEAAPLHKGNRGQTTIIWYAKIV
jgi:tRNA/tmRNA/rRNA uracil-C5-methylase (TrmA/RlmC/RlmD family)